MGSNRMGVEVTSRYLAGMEEYDKHYISLDLEDKVKERRDVERYPGGPKVKKIRESLPEINHIKSHTNNY